MRRWLWAQGDDWWLDPEPPSDIAGEDARIDEVRFGSRSDAFLQLNRIFGESSLLDPVLEALGPGASAGALCNGRLEALSWLLEHRRVRLWRRRRLGSPVSASAGGEQAVDAQRFAGPPPSARGSSALGSDGGGSSRGGAAPIPKAPVGTNLSFYEFVLLDELDTGIEGVDVEMNTPKGLQWLKTSGSGSVRVEAAPPGKGSARVDPESLALALQRRVHDPRRLSKPPPETEDFQVVTPSRIKRRFSFPDARPHRVMVISRTDTVIVGADPKWMDLALRDSSKPASRYDGGDFHLVGLCSRALGETALMDGEVASPPEPSPDAEAALARAAASSPAYVVQPGDSLFAIAERFLGGGARWPELASANMELLTGRPDGLIHPGELLVIPIDIDGLMPEPEPFPGESAIAPPAFLNADIDTAHEALFDATGDQLFESLVQPLQRLRAPGLLLDPPIPAARALAAQAVFVASELGLALERIINPPEPEGLNAEEQRIMAEGNRPNLDNSPAHF